MPLRSRCASRSSISALLAGAAGGALATLSLMERRHRAARARLRAAAREREAERAFLAGQLVTAEQDERRRLSLWLHDGPLQALSGVALMHDAVLAALREGRIDDAVPVLEDSLAREREIVRTLRDLSFAIEPVVLRDQGFDAAMQALADQVAEAKGIEVLLELAAAAGLDEKAHVALYQTLREALNQAVRRRPSRILVRVDAGPEGLAAVVSDDGVGERRQASTEAIGERARVLHGLVAVDSTAGQGTTVRIEFPEYVAAA